MNRKPLELDMLAGSEVRDLQGEMLSLDGADISEINFFCDNHGKGFFNRIGQINEAKKIFSEADCENDRHRHYWEKVKFPFLYVRGILYDDDDHPNARAAAAVLRSVYKHDAPLKMKASVEGGVIARSAKDPSILERTKVLGVALTFTPANNTTLVEPLSLDKAATDEEYDKKLIASVMHLVKSDVPTFRQITRDVSAKTIIENLNKSKELAESMGIHVDIPEITEKDLIQEVLIDRISDKITNIHQLLKAAIDVQDSHEQLLKKVQTINSLTKALVAGYGGAGAPASRVGGAVLQSEQMDDGRGGFKYITCDDCGNEQVYMKHQVKCRKCNKNFSLEKLNRYL